VSVLRQLFDGARARAMGMGMVDRRCSDVLRTLATHVRPLWSVPGRTWRLPLRQLRSAVHLLCLISSPALLGRPMESFTVVSRRSAALLGQAEAQAFTRGSLPVAECQLQCSHLVRAGRRACRGGRPRRIGHACIATGIDLNPRSDKPGRQPSSSGGTSSRISGKRWISELRAIRPSNRASGAPRQ
jgi:hypothetical protein